MNDINKLVEKSKSDDKRAFEELYRLTVSEVYRYCRSLCKNTADACDLMQEVYFVAWRKLDQYGGINFTAWLNSIAHNLRMDMLKKEKDELYSEDNFTELSADESSNPENQCEKLMSSEEIIAIIDGVLSENQKSAVMKYYYDEKSVGEIAAEMNCSEGTVKTRLRLARKKLGREFKNRNVFSFAMPWLIRYDAEQADFTHFKILSPIEAKCLLSVISAAAVVGGTLVLSDAVPYEHKAVDNSELCIYNISESADLHTETTYNTTSEIPIAVNEEMICESENNTEEVTYMNKTVKTAVSSAVTAALITLGTAAQTEISAELVTENIVVKNNISAEYDHESSVRKFRENTVEKALGFYEGIDSMINALNKEPSVFAYDDSSGYYTVDIGIIPEIYEEYNGAASNYFKKAPDGRFFRNRKSGKSAADIIDNFEIKNIEGFEYITLDGHDYECCTGTDEKTGEPFFYNNIMGEPSMWVEWYGSTRTGFIDDADYENIFYLADKIYETMNNELYDYKCNVRAKCKDSGFDDIEQYRRFLSESQALFILEGMTMNCDRIPESIEPFLDENGIFSADINNDEKVDEKDIEILKKYYGNECRKFDVDFDSALTVKDLAQIKKYLIKDAELSPIQKFAVKNADNSIDVRTVAKVANKLVGQ